MLASIYVSSTVKFTFFPELNLKLKVSLTQFSKETVVTRGEVKLYSAKHKRKIYCVTFIIDIRFPKLHASKLATKIETASMAHQLRKFYKQMNNSSKILIFQKALYLLNTTYFLACDNFFKYWYCKNSRSNSNSDGQCTALALLFLYLTPPFLCQIDEICNRYWKRNPRTLTS